MGPNPETDESNAYLHHNIFFLFTPWSPVILSRPVKKKFSISRKRINLSKPGKEIEGSEQDKPWISPKNWKG
jgi:hypothetical protein